MILISGFLIFVNWGNEGKLVIGGSPNTRHERRSGALIHIKFGALHIFFVIHYFALFLVAHTSE